METQTQTAPTTAPVSSSHLSDPDNWAWVYVEYFDGYTWCYVGPGASTDSPPWLVVPSTAAPVPSLDPGPLSSLPSE